MALPDFTTGQSVKIRSNGERFWVVFGCKLPSTPNVSVFCGYVDNHLITLPYKPGDAIFFTGEQVVDWWDE